MLVSLEVRWKAGEVVVHLRHWEAPHLRIVGVAVRDVQCPRRLPWGPSASVNDVRGPARADDGAGERLEIEMQSGDTIVLVAERFEVHEGDAAPP